MTWSLKIQNGDLTTEGARFSTVTREAKLLQDLRLHLLEPLGTDEFHSTYGSDIADVIGSVDWDEVATSVHSEITRIVQERQQVQLTRAKTDRYTYGRATLDPGEVLLNLVGMRMTQVADALVVRVIIQTGKEEQIALDVPLANSNQIQADSEILS